MKAATHVAAFIIFLLTARWTVGINLSETGVTLPFRLTRAELFRDERP
jgi:hypothetical protein